MSANMVRLHSVGKEVAPGKYAVRNISFDLNRGEFSYITGLNGAGKTTLLRLLFAMEHASEGSIVVNNREISRLGRGKVPDYRREVGFVFQDFKLLPDLNVFDNVALPLEIRGMSPGEMTYRVKGVLSLVGLEDREKDSPTSLSAGEQQRVAIARSIITKPNLLLADEPTGNLDNRTARDIMGLFQEIHEMGTTVLVATHDELLMEDFPARVIQLENGRVINDSGRDSFL